MNKRFLTFLLTLLISAIFFAKCGSTKMSDQKPKGEQQQSVSRNLIIYYDPAIGKEKLVKTIEEYGAKLLFDYENLHGVAIEIPTGKSLKTATTYFEKVEGVVSVSQDEIMQISEPQR